MALSLSLEGSAQAIFNGHDAHTADFPWYVTLTYKGSEYCGGALIATDMVITAAHCVPADTRPLKVVFGYRSRHPVIVGPGRVEANDYNAAKKLNDVAILFIDSRPPSASPIGLVNRDPQLGASLTSVGFGCSSAPLTCTRSPSQLQGIALQRTNDKDCEPLSATEFCVASGRASLNHGDSGGPVMVKTGSGWQLAALNTAVILRDRGKVMTHPYRAAVTSIARERTWITSVFASPQTRACGRAYPTGLLISVYASSSVSCSTARKIIRVVYGQCFPGSDGRPCLVQGFSCTITTEPNTDVSDTRCTNGPSELIRAES